MLARRPLARYPFPTNDRWHHARSWLARQLLRRLWLPSAIYRLVPWIYLGLGSTSLAGALVLPEPAWMLPYIALLGLAGIHAGYYVAALRRRPRARRPAGG